MTTSFFRPGTHIQEVKQTRRPIQGVSSSIPAFNGIAKRGPIGEPVFVTGITDFERVFGGPIEDEALYLAVDGFFKNAGQAVGLGAYIQRLGHYTNLGTKTLASVPASTDVDGRGIASFAQFTGNVDTTTVALAAGDSLSFDIDNTGVDVATIDATPATVDGVAGGFPVGGANDTADYIINGGPTKSIDLNGVSGTLADYVNALNIQMEGVQVTDDGGGQLRLTTDREGSSASIQLLNFGATFAASTGLAAATTASAGPNNVADTDLITFAELKALIEDDVKTTTPGDKLLVTQNGNGFMVLTATISPAGATSEIDLTAGAAAMITALGLGLLGSQGAGSEVNGSATAAAPTLTVEAGYRGFTSPGLDGNRLWIEILFAPKFASSGVGADLASDATSGTDTLSLTSLTGIAIGAYLLLEEGATSEVRRVTGVDTSVVGATVVHTVTLASNLTNSYVAVNSTVTSLEHTLNVYEDDTQVETWPQLSMNPAVANYAPTVINDSEVGSNRITVTDLGLAFPGNVLDTTVGLVNLTGGTSELTGFVVNDITGDEAGKSGLFALDALTDVNLLAVPPSFGAKTTIPANSVIHNAMLLYAGTRMDMFAILDSPDNQTVPQAKNYRNNTMGADSKWGAIYYPFLEVADPLGLGSAPTVFVPPSGHMAGIYARVDGIDPPEGGVATAPAGEGDFGKVRGAVGLRVYVTDKEHEVLNPAGINAIRRFDRGGIAAPGIIVYGARTLSTDLNFRYIQVRRLMTFVEQSIRIGTRFAVFRNNDFRLWGKLTDIVTAFLRGLHRRGQLNGRTQDEAFFVKIDEETTTPTDVGNGVLNAQIGISPQRPAEFIVFFVSQFQSGSTITEQ